MNRVIRFPDQRRDQEQAVAWIAALDRGLRGDEQEQLRQWLGEDVRRRQELLNAASLWDHADVLAELAELFPLQEEPASGRMRAAAMAAVVLVGLVGLVATLFELHPRPHHRAVASATAGAVSGTAEVSAPPASMPFEASYTTAVGEQRTVALPDNSTIRLNTNTALRVRYTATARLLEMVRGEANFEVARDPARLFTVRVAGFDFNAVGTAFNIRADSAHGVKLTVTQGRVRIHRAPSPVVGAQSSVARPEVNDDMEVGANKELVIGQSTERIEALQLEQVAVATAWQRGMIVFDATPLQQVVAELARYSTRRFVIEDASIGRVPVSGYFKIGDLDALAAALQQNFGIDVHENNSQILLSPGPK